MRVYSYQGLEVASILFNKSIYYSDIDKCCWPKDIPNLKGIWQWLIDEYNFRKGVNYISAPVWWYTSLKELKSNMKHENTSNILLTADIPDNILLFYDADLYEAGPFSCCHLGWSGHRLKMSNNWIATDEELFDNIYNAYRKNLPAMIETWSEIFNIRRSDGTQRLHAITPYIDITWMKG